MPNNSERLHNTENLDRRQPGVALLGMFCALADLYPSTLDDVEINGVSLKRHLDRAFSNQGPTNNLPMPDKHVRFGLTVASENGGTEVDCFDATALVSAPDKSLLIQANIGTIKPNDHFWESLTQGLECPVTVKYGQKNKPTGEFVYSPPLNPTS